MTGLPTTQKKETILDSFFSELESVQWINAIKRLREHCFELFLIHFQVAVKSNSDANRVLMRYMYRCPYLEFLQFLIAIESVFRLRDTVVFRVGIPFPM